MKVAMILGKLALALTCIVPLYGCSEGSSRNPDTPPVVANTPDDQPQQGEQPEAEEQPEETNEPEDESGEQAPEDDPAPGGDTGDGGAPESDKPDPTADASAIRYNDMGVHDPSVIRDTDGTYYVFGSHLAAAKTTDLMTWERVADGVNDTNPLFNTYASEIAEGLEWVGGHQGSWAADVIQLGDGRYYFYYNHCANPASDAGDCNLPRSYLGVAVSDDIEGPYTDLGIFLRSGMTDEEVASGYGPEGVESYDPTIHPNAIDPDVFYDRDGKLWMTYGSYSGGIFILEMDETTAMPKPGQGYGKHLTGGNHSAIEGTYMLYSPESDYYYLFMSFGGYVSTDGYNIRVARSRTPDGPFLDAEGNDMVAARGNWDSIAPYGVKLMGGFVFASDPGDPVPSRGYLAPGHNSAYYSAETGKHLLFTHTRFPNRGEAHAIRVHELFINADGWPVASPHRYAPIKGDNVVDAGDLVGGYKFVNHGKDINRTAKETRYITLGEDGSVSGQVSGSYQLFEDDARRIDLALEIDGEIRNYTGIMQWQWNSAAEKLVPIFTAQSGRGESIWGSRMETRGTSAVIADILAELELPAVARTSELALPTEATRGAKISWMSSDEQVIGSDGHVTRPNAGSNDADTTLTATVNLSGENSSESFTIRVPARLPFNRSAHFAFEDDLAESLGRFADGSATGDRIFNNGSVTFSAGRSKQAVRLDGGNGVLLPEGLIDNDEYTVSLWANPAAITQFTPTFFGTVDEEMNASNRWISLVPESWDNNTMLWSRDNSSWFNGSAGERIPTATWTHMAVSVERGSARVYLDGELKFAGTGVADFFTGKSGRFALGVDYWNTPFNGLIDELKIYDSALSAEEIRLMDIEGKTTSELLAAATESLDIGLLGAVNYDLHLPASGAFASAIEWQSSNPSVISVEGETGRVTLPAADTQVTLTATLTLDGQVQSKSFPATVVASTLPQPIARFGFEQTLEEGTGNFTSGSVAGATIGSTGGTISYATGAVGQAAVFDGNSGIELPDNLIRDSAYSFSLWLSPAELTAYTPSFFGLATTESWISLLPGGFGEDAILWSGTDWYDGATGVALATNTWTHLAVTVDRGEVRVYVNGELVHSGSGFPDLFPAAENTQFALGINYWDTPYRGLMDEVKVYANPLTAEEVTEVYEAELLGEQ